MRCTTRLAVAAAGALLLGSTHNAEAQLHGHVVAGVGQHSSSAVSDSIVEMAAGAEGRFSSGRLGVAVDLGYLTPTDGLTRGRGVLASSLVIRPSTTSAIRPFVSAGYALLFRTSAAHAVTVGGGVEYWTRPRLGLRLELRDHIHSPRGGVRSHFWSVRLGIVAR